MENIHNEKVTDHSPHNPYDVDSLTLFRENPVFSIASMHHENFEEPTKDGRPVVLGHSSL
jgi:hypothetical protein